MMSPDEEKMIALGLEAMMRPVDDAFKNITDESTKTLGKVLNGVLCRQLRNLAGVYNRATEMAGKIGLPLDRVPLKVLKPILDGASLEEDVYLQELWAALLANASTDTADEISAAFPEVLRQLSARDVAVLDFLFKRSFEVPGPVHDLGTSVELHVSMGQYTDTELFHTLEMLLHHSLIATAMETEATHQQLEAAGLLQESMARHFRVPPFGARFIRACQPPETTQ